MPWKKEFTRTKERLKRGLGITAQDVISTSSPDQSHPTPGALPETSGHNVPLKLDDDPVKITSIPKPVSVLPLPPQTQTWGGLESLLRIVESSVDVFGPLKSAIGGLNQCIEIFEIASKGHKDYQDLQIQLNSLLGDLCNFLGGPASPTMTASMNNLSIAISEEIQLIKEKSARSNLRRHLEALDDSDEILGCYRRIKEHLDRLMLNSNLSIWGTVDILKEGLLDARLRQLSPTFAAHYDSAESRRMQRRKCTPGTRMPELERLLAWTHDRTATNILWMNGMAGTGKTTIAYSFCAELEKKATLGASFFCSRSIPECRNVDLILPAISYQLAQFSRPFRYALSEVLEAEPDVHTRVLEKQFESLFVKPLSKHGVRDALPVDFVIVIDALDECDDKDSVGYMLDLLLASKNQAELPLRFLISSRPDHEIYSRLAVRMGDGLKSHLVLHDLDARAVQDDIETYLRDELQSAGLSVSQIAALARCSGTLFIFASTAARYIKDGLRFLEHEERLKRILGLSSVHTSEKDKEIDKLYTTILHRVFREERLDESIQTQMKAVLDVVVCAQEPITVKCIAGLLKYPNENQVDALLRPLNSVLNIGETTGLVATLHASFPEYMHSQERSTLFHCDPANTHLRIAMHCLNLMETDLKFNICGLESSYIRDNDLAMFLEHAERAVSQHLFYASRYWASHIVMGKHFDLRNDLHQFLSMRLLPWMEVLNVKKCMHLGPAIMRLAEAWARNNGCSEETIDLAHDGWRFVTMFAGNAVSQSTPHIYASMVPFWPETAPIARYYKLRMKRSIKPQGTALTRRPLALMATWTFSGSAQSACSSFNGSLLAFGIGSSVNVVDAITGRFVVGPLKHTAIVWSVTFSPDGTLVISGSADKTIRVWSAQDGHLVGDPFTGHTEAIRSVFCTANGTRIISGSDDSTIRVWDVKSGNTLFSPIVGHARPILSVCASLDGACIASGSRDSTLRVWDLTSGKSLLGPLEGHTGWVRSVCFSPDSTKIVSGSDDNTIRVWDSRNGQLVAGPFRGHSGAVSSISFAPNGKQLVSGSHDSTIRLWNLKAALGSSIVFVGHSNAVNSVSFSPDGTHIVSASHDKTIRTWDAQSLGSVEGPLEGHTGAITSVSFSDNAACIISGSYDETICTWDTQSGQMIGLCMKDKGWVMCTHSSPDGALLASGSWRNAISLWDLKRGRSTGKALTGHSKGVLSVCFSPDGSLLASGSADKMIRIWSIQTGGLSVGPLTGHTAWVQSVCFSPDGTRIVSGSSDKTIRVWDAQSGKNVLGPMTGHTRYVHQVCFSPDGTRIVSSSADSTIRIWDAHTGEVVLGPLTGHSGGVKSVCFSPNGALLASGSGDRAVRLWDARSGLAVGRPLLGHTKAVRSVSFSSDGQKIVSGSEDTTIRVWDISSLVESHLSEEALSSTDRCIPPPHHPSWELKKDGWIVDSQSRLLAWVPPDLHIGLLAPSHNPLIISTRGLFRLNFEHAGLGESWAKYYDPEL